MYGGVVELGAVIVQREQAAGVGAVAAQQGVQSLDRGGWRQQVGVRFADVAEVDQRMGRAEFRHAPAHEVDQRIDAGGLDVWVALQVVGAVEEPGDVGAGGDRQAEIAADGLAGPVWCRPGGRRTGRRR